MIPFNPSLPDITKCEPIRAYRIDDRLVLLVKNPKPLYGPASDLIEYLYALAVVTNDKEMVLMVTSERSGESLRAIVKNTSELEQTKEPFLCVFTESGAHLNLGNSPDWGDEDKFTERALKVVCEHLKTNALPIKLQAKPKKAIASVRKSAAVAIVILGIVALVIFLRLPKTYEDCILENMKGTSVNSAAIAIRGACRAKFPSP